MKTKKIKKKTTKAKKKTPSPAKKTSKSKKKAAAPGKKTAKAKKKTSAPAKKKTTASKKKTVVTKKKASPPKKKTAAVKKKTSLVKKKAPVAKKKTPAPKKVSPTPEVMNKPNGSPEKDFSYPAKQDIYTQEKREENLNPDDYSVITEGNKSDNEWNEKDFKQDHTGDDLDVPNPESEPDVEDEENDYFSLGDTK